jgi:hypothetical protein
MFLCHEAYSLLPFLRNASQPYERLYIYCVYISKMHRKSFFYEITTHLIHDFRAYSDKVNYVFEGGKFPSRGGGGWGQSLGGGISWDTGVNMEAEYIALYLK